MVSRHCHHWRQQKRLVIGIVTGAERRAVRVGYGRGRPALCLTATQSEADQNPDWPLAHDSSRLARSWIGVATYTSRPTRWHLASTPRDSACGKEAENSSFNRPREVGQDIF
jgi:hypothetical protein